MYKIGINNLLSFTPRPMRQKLKILNNLSYLTAIVVLNSRISSGVGGGTLFSLSLSLCLSRRHQTLCNLWALCNFLALYNFLALGCLYALSLGYLRTLSLGRLRTLRILWILCLCVMCCGLRLCECTLLIITFVVVAIRCRCIRIR